MKEYNDQNKNCQENCQDKRYQGDYTAKLRIS